MTENDMVYVERVHGAGGGLQTELLESLIREVFPGVSDADNLAVFEFLKRSFH
jgi:hypothetical protein